METSLFWGIQQRLRPILQNRAQGHMRKSNSVGNCWSKLREGMFLDMRQGQFKHQRVSKTQGVCLHTEILSIVRLRLVMKVIGHHLNFGHLFDNP